MRKPNVNMGNFVLSALVAVLILVIVVAILIVLGLLTIMSLNTLFPALAIGYSVGTVAAVVFLLSVLLGQFKVSK